jgi:starch synthase
MLEGSGPDVRLILVGDGPDAKVLSDQIARLRIQGVTFVNRLVHDVEMIREYLVAGDVYVFPSRHEGFAVAPIEAMACGLPLVAADAGGISEALPEGEGSGGLVVAREDPAALHRALARLLADPELAQVLGSRARRRAIDVFSYEAVGRRLAGFLIA